MIAVVTWKWSAPVPAKGRPGDLTGGRYTADHVNALASMVARNLAAKHRFICVTDDASGLGPGIQVLRMPEDSARHWRCCRRLRMFSKEWRDVLGERVLHLDLDTVIVGDISPLARMEDPVVGWLAPQFSGPAARRQPSLAINPSVLLFDPGGPLRDCWDWYASDPQGQLERAERNGWNKWNSDMSILNDYIATHGVDVRQVGTAEGIYGLRDDIIPRGSPELPANARIVSFCDPKFDPAMPDLQARYPWIAAHWTE